ncbi:fimbria/pilus outer membrane usher protein (plasmid) [Enterobacteriaceae bacterium Kacie_13]|nr:fimbria/pilus outer membrane usher protein [Enterobacteriaceae bacterium Kacie_13]
MAAAPSNGRRLTITADIPLQHTSNARYQQTRIITGKIMFSPTPQMRLTPLSQFIARQVMHSVVLGSLMISGGAFADGDIYFNPQALDMRGGNGQVVADLSAFENGAQLPGNYRVDIYLNNNFIETRDVEFVADGKNLVPVLTAKYWRELGIKPEASPALVALSDDETVSKPGEYVEDASATLNFRKLRLDLSIPQASLLFRARDAVSPELWDHGMPALLLNYGLNYNNSWQRQSDGEYSNLFLRLDSGLNLAGWRLRNNATFTRNTGKQPGYDENGNRITKQDVMTRWQSLNTYAQHDVHALGAQLTLGDTSTPGDLFDSIQFRGAQLASDDGMLPDSMRGFAPVVRGVARSNAQVTIRQNSAVIYQTSVAAGAFEIRDLYPTASSGNLEVTIREADGSESTFVQPFSAVPGMQREGQLRFSVTGGKYRSWSEDVRTPEFGQGTVQYGLTNTTSAYGGLLGSKDYQSGLLGIGQGLGTFGSVSLDVTHAETSFDNATTRAGQSYRAQYAKDILQSGTSFVLAGYRYSTSGFYDFREANEILLKAPKKDNDDTLETWRRTHNKRSRMQAQVSQRLGDYGSLSLTAYQQDYWGNDGAERTFMLGYGVSHAGISYSLNVSDTRYPNSEPNRSVYLNVSIPLDRWLAGSRTSYSMYTDNRNRVRNQVGVSGSSLENRLNWSASESYANKNEGDSGSMTANYAGTYGNVNGGYSYSSSNHQVNAGLNGGIVAHPYGVTLSQPLGDTMALVRVPEAGGVQVKNQRGVKTDWRGYAVVPYLTPYRRNNIGLGTDSLADDVELDETVKTVVPTRGALVMADYKASVGARVLATIHHLSKPLPFGTTVSLIIDGKQTGASFVGDNGDVYLSGVPEKSRVKAKWGTGADQQCTGEVKLAPAEKDSRFRTATINCR